MPPSRFKRFLPRPASPLRRQLRRRSGVWPSTDCLSAYHTLAERLCWVHSSYQTKRHLVAAEIRNLALKPSDKRAVGRTGAAHRTLRKIVRDVVKFAAPVFWNVRVS